MYLSKRCTEEKVHTNVSSDVIPWHLKPEIFSMQSSEEVYAGCINNIE